MSVSFFDCDIGVGQSGLGLPVTATSVETLSLMDRYDIADALVHDRGQHETGDFRSHDFILEFCRDQPRLHPVIPIVPPATGEQLPPLQLVDLCLENGVRAVRVSPVAHRFAFDRYFLGPLFAELEKHRIPVLCNTMALQDHPWEHAPAWRDIRDAAVEFPGLPIIVIYTGMLQGRSLFPVLAQCPNVIVDLNCSSFQFVEAVVEKFGSGRVIFASHFPSEDPGLYTTCLNYSDIPEEARGAVAGDNVRRLLEAVK